ncbi:MAG: hypothetical protein ACO1SX_24925 [Actinomycetota bacterium]
MPIIDDQTRGTDRQPAPRWAWVVAIIVFCVFWLAVATLGSMGRLIWDTQRNAATPTTATRNVNSSLVRQAEEARARGDWLTASSSIDAVDETAPLGLMEKHTYLRVGAVSKAKNGDPAKSAELYDRFLSMGVQIRKPECQGCHAAGTVAPNRVSDLKKSDLGMEYWRQLKAAGALDATRKQLRKEWQRKPTDARLNLLLYHLEKHSGRDAAAAKHATALSRAENVK